MRDLATARARQARRAERVATMYTKLQAGIEQLHVCGVGAQREDAAVRVAMHGGSRRVCGLRSGEEGRCRRAVGHWL